MKKFVRFAGVAVLALTIGVASCGDDDDPVTPVTPVAPPPPLVVTMAPASQTIGVGGTVVFAVSVSGGVAGEAASWTCDSSDPSMATVTMTSAGCAATAVAAGGVTITAAVTKGGVTVNTAAGLTITEDMAERASLFIASIKDSDSDSDEDDGVLSRTVSVTLSVEFGDQMRRQLSVLVDGVVAEILSFEGASAVAASQDEPAQQAVHPFVLSFNSAEYDAVTGEPTYMNGKRTISAQLMVVGSDEPIESGFHPREFANGNGVHVTVSGLGEGAMNSKTGQRWYGGPEAALAMTVMPVLYSAGSAASVSVTLLALCGADAATETSETSVTFTPECSETSNTVATVIDEVVTDPAGDSPRFVIADAEVDILNDDVFPLYLDYEGPDAPYFNANPNGREQGWVNLSVDFLGKFNKISNKEGWLHYGSAGGGVGGYTPLLRYSTTSPSIVDGATAVVDPLATVLAPELIAAGSKKDAICVVATAVDLLGNESELPSDGEACATADAYKAAYTLYAEALEADVAEDNLPAVPAGLRGGLDTQAPTIEFSTASPKENDSELIEFQVQVADVGGSTGKSGLHSDEVLAKVEVRDADDKMICGDDKAVGGAAGAESVSGVCELAPLGEDRFNDPLATTSGLNGAEKVGYYTFTALAQDRAGNRSEEKVRTAVNDDDDPNVGVIIGGYAKGSYSLTVTLTDNLSIRNYWAEARFGGLTVTDEVTIGGLAISHGGLLLPREGGVEVDAYNVDGDLSQSKLESPKVLTFRGLQQLDGTTITPLESLGIVATDHGGNESGANGIETTFNPSLAVALADKQLLIREATTFTFAMQDEDDALAYDEVFQSFSAMDTSVEDDVIELRAKIAGTVGYIAAKAPVVADPGATTPVEAAEAVDGMEGLEDNPVSRVDFYAAVMLRDKSAGDGGGDRVPPVPYGAGLEALVFIGSADAHAAKDILAANDEPAMREFAWVLDVSRADFLAAVGGGAVNYTAGDIIAFAVNSDGVALHTATAAVGSVTVEK